LKISNRLISDFDFWISDLSVSFVSDFELRISDFHSVALNGGPVSGECTYFDFAC